MIRRYSLLILVLMVFLTACKTYDEGPSLSLYSKGQRVAGNWFFTKVMFNENDSTDSYLAGAMEFLLYDGKGKDRGAYTWNKLYGSQDFNPDNIFFGSWQFFAGKDSIRMILLNKEFKDTTDWKILRLAYNEWWMERQYDDTTRLRWELWKAIF